MNASPRSRRVAASALGGLLLAALLSACGDDSGSESGEDLPNTSPTTTAPQASESPSRTRRPKPSGSESASASPSATATPPGVPEGKLPGDPADGLPPQAGDRLSVVGVVVGDVLNLRRLPDPGADPVMNGIDALADDVLATGRNRFVDSGMWAEVVVGGDIGWVNAGYLGYVTEPRRARVDVGGLTAADPRALGAAIAEQVDPGADVTLAKVTAGDRPELVIDLLGQADDASRGTRLWVSAVSDADGVRVHRIRQSSICSRGLAAGTCL